MTARDDRYALARLRKHWAAVIAGSGAYPCGRCGRLIFPDSAWDVGHILPHADGGRATLQNTAPEHRRCNTRAGGKRGAAITNAKRHPNRGGGRVTSSYEL